MSEKHLISVLMGVYYHKPSMEPLYRAVRSILEQEWESMELIICDEGSSQEALQLLEEFSHQDIRIKLVRNQGKKLLSEKLNACLQMASGAFIARMDDDDCAYPLRLTRQMEFLEAHPEIAFVGCDVDYLLEDGSMKSNFPERPTPKDFYFSMPFVHPSLLFRREALEQVGGYDESKMCHLCEDYDLLLRMYEKGFQGANLKERLFGYSLVGTEQKKRTFSARWNEVRVRYHRFGALGLLPTAMPYVIKPLVVGLLPVAFLNLLRRKRLLLRAERNER